MGVLADLYLSRNDSEAVQYDVAPDSFADREQYGNFTQLELSTLWAGMRNIKWDVNLCDDFRNILVEDEGERIICGLPAAMTVELAQLTPSEISSNAVKWSATDEMNCKPTDVQPLIEGLVRLAKKATESGRNIYLWNCC
jgi:hypothetical protein